mgnify:CR=1 FL=1
MAKIIINESNMDFEFEESNLYIPEKEEFMGKLPLTSICDFIYEYKKDTIFIIEAKTGIPNFNNRKSISNFQEYKISFNGKEVPNPNKPLPEDNIHQFQMEILKKFNDTLIVYCAVILDRLKNISVNNNMKNINHLKNDISMILVVKNLDSEYVAEWSDVFKSFMEPLKKRFSIKDTLILNETMAKKHNLIK